MDIENDNRNAPSYLAHYAMHRPPFATKTEDDMYYSEPTRNQRLDILQHLTQYGNEMLLVTGVPGSGKSTLIHRFLIKAPDNWKICSLDAHAKMDEEQLLYRICHGFNLPLEPGALRIIITHVKRQLDQLLAGTPTVVVVIDNAHELSNSALALLTELAKVKNQHSGALLRIILFAEPQIKIQFAAIESENKPKYAIRKIDLPPFDEKHTGELIRHRTRVAGLHADSTFTEAAISKIHKQSQGIPGDIVELAHRVLFEMTPLKRRTKTKPMVEPTTPKTRLPMRLIAGIIAVLAVAMILIFQDEINKLYSQKTEPSSSSEPVPQHTVSTLAIPELSEEMINNEPNNVNEDSAATQNDQLTAENDDEAVFANPDRDQTSVPHPPTNDGNQISPPVAIASRAQPALARDIHQETWLMDQSPNHYTLQLVAGYQKSTVNNYINLHNLPAAELAYYRSLNKGKDWHSLVYGIYPDYRSAKLAIDTLPPTVRQSKPWIRRLKKIQTEIKAAAGN